MWAHAAASAAPQEEQSRKMSSAATAVVLLSGGLDSATTAAIAKDAGFDLYALTIHYGQRHSVETDAATQVAKQLGIRTHVFQNIDLRAIGGSALTSDIDVPKSDLPQTPSAEIPVTYVPARNTIFLSFALAHAEVAGARDIFVGVNAVDYSGYPDCRPDFIAAFERVANLGTRAGLSADPFRIRTPLIDLKKEEIIRRGTALGVDYALTHSCYDPSEGGLACGRCDSCHIRREGFARAGVPDPTRYAQ